MKNFTFNYLVISLILLSSFSGDKINLVEEWETEPIFSAPESIVYDSFRNCLYVSNYNNKGGFRNLKDTLYDEFISKIDLEGNIEEFKWIDSLLGPTGVAIHDDKLYIVERGALVIANIEKQRVEKRIKISGTGFLNDIVVDKNGTVYMSDSFDNCIYRVKGENFEKWCVDTLLNSCNGLYIDTDCLLVGVKGAANLLSISLSDKSVEVIADCILTNVDGIRKIGDNYILSWQSDIILFNPNKGKTILMHSDKEKLFYADFELVEKYSQIFVPTLTANNVITFSIK